MAPRLIAFHLVAKRLTGLRMPVRYVGVAPIRAAALLLTITPASPVVIAQQPAIEKEIRYVSGGNRDQTLDLFVPAARNFPTVIFIHGGSLQEVGERRTSPVYQGVCPPLAAVGIACATIDYRLAPASKWPAMPDDAAAALKWVKANIGARGGNPNRIVLFGHSSGCELASILGANPKYLAGVGLHPSDIAGIVAMGCVLSPLEGAMTRLSSLSPEEVRQRWEKSSDRDTYATLEDQLDSDPSRFIGPEMPPLLVVVAEAERFMPAILEQGAKVVRRLLEMKRSANLVIVPGRHMTSIANFGAPGDPTFAAVKAFVDNPASVAPKD
jgi:acetyl esterase/lipase